MCSTLWCLTWAHSSNKRRYREERQLAFAAEKGQDSHAGAVNLIGKDSSSRSLRTTTAVLDTGRRHHLDENASPRRIRIYSRGTVPLEMTRSRSTFSPSLLSLPTAHRPYQSEAETSFSAPPEIAHGCLLIPVFVAAWWFWTRRAARRAWVGLLTTATGTTGEHENEHEHERQHHHQEEHKHGYHHSRRGMQEDDEITAEVSASSIGDCYYCYPLETMDSTSLFGTKRKINPPTPGRLCREQDSQQCGGEEDRPKYTSDNENEGEDGTRDREGESATPLVRFVRWIRGSSGRHKQRKHALTAVSRRSLSVTATRRKRSHDVGEKIPPIIQPNSEHDDSGERNCVAMSTIRTAKGCDDGAAAATYSSAAAAVAVAVAVASGAGGKNDQTQTDASPSPSPSPSSGTSRDCP